MLPSAGRAPLTTFSLLLGRCIQAQTCYYPDHTVEPTHIVCNASAQISLCCEPDAMCLISGLCFSVFDTSINTGTCTDVTGTDHSCFQQCPLSPGIDHGYHTLYRCNDNNWCCSTGGNTTSCCDDEGVELFVLKDHAAVMGGTGFLAGFTIAPVDLLQTRRNPVAPTALATHIAIDSGPTKHQSWAVGNNTAAAQTPHTESTASASDATKTGLGAGLGVGVPLLAGLILALFFIRRLRSRNNSQRTDREKKAADVVLDGDITARHVRHEMESLPSEMPNSRLETTQELGV